MIGYFNGNAVVDGLWHHEFVPLLFREFVYYRLNLKFPLCPDVI